MADPILVAKATGDLFLLPKLANRHGLIAGATGTGKTVTLQRLAEGFSRIGVPVFMADVKGDLSGICRAADPPKQGHSRSRRASSASRISSRRPRARPCSGTSSASRATRCGRRSPRWARFCLRGYSA